MTHVNQLIGRIWRAETPPTTYSHLAVIDRVDVLKRIDSCRLSPHYQRENTRATQWGTHHEGGLVVGADALLELGKTRRLSQRTRAG